MPEQLAAPKAPAVPTASYVRWFEELDVTSVATAGGKGANLGAMLRAALPVPPGFVVTVDAFDRTFGGTEVKRRIREGLSGLDPDHPGSLERGAAQLRAMVEAVEIPADVRAAIVDAYAELSRRAAVDAELVAVRSSATVEDAATLSFAGMFRSFLNVRGTDELLERVLQCWGSLFTARSLAYRSRQQLLEDQHIAVIVQRMVDAEKSGVLFTVDPATGSTSHLLIEAAWGLGEPVVSGQVTPDRYVVDKATLRIVERSIARKDFKLVRSAAGNTERVDLDEAAALASSLTDDEVIRLARLGLRDEEHYGRPQDAEWAIAGGEVFLVQTRPVTATARGEARVEVPGGGGGPRARGRPGGRLGAGLPRADGRGGGDLLAGERARRRDDLARLGAAHAPSSGDRDGQRRRDQPRRHRVA